MALQVEKAITPKLGITPQTATATVTGTGIDCSGHQEVVYALMVGAVSGTTPTLDVAIQESATVGGTYTALSPAVAFAQVTTATHQLHVGAPVNIAKPFQRVVATIAGTTPSFLMSVALLKVNPELLPAAAGA